MSEKFLQKRKYARINLHDPIRLITSEYTFEEYMGNISKTGCMILTLQKKDLNEEIQVSIKDPTKGYVNFDGEVKRIRERAQEDIDAQNKEIKDLLFVDDDPDVNSSVCEALNEEFELENCFNAAQARDLLEQFHFRAILTDARMPGEDGASLLSHVLKVQPECRRLMLTGEANNELLQNAINQGEIEKILYKPIDVKALKDSLRECIKKGGNFDASKNTHQRHYNCYSCQYSAYRVEMVDGVKWESKSKEELEKDIHFFQGRKSLGEKICPKCSEKTFLSMSSQVFEVGVQFTNLNKDLDDCLDRVITHALNVGDQSGKRKDARVEGNYIPVKMEKLYGSGADLFDAYISDISRGGLRIESEKEYEIGQKINLDLGLKKSEIFKISAKIMHRTKQTSGFIYGLQFEYFDTESQAQLKHFIDSLALTSYQERENKKQKKKLAAGVGGAGFTGYAGGFISAFLIFGGFYIFSDYQIRKERVITITEGGKKYSLDLDKLSTESVKGLPKAIKKKVTKAWQVCKNKKKLDRKCMETQLLSFSKPVTMNKAINIDEMESQILKDGKDIRPSQMDKFYNRLQSSNLSKEQKLVRYKKFEKKVKRAIQLEQFSDNN